ncbi:HAD-IA family hydrolase [Roseobacter sp. YSTF-M11]|uniref:HAD-IA family hydrolase n=1 Tax=Roseobacter insulae TaxID=2859783 RepID=A0A9X1FYB0_9RHOB|nr:HAD-IA family hydrolase [Roseobacter insulae]MBW4709882.1 HAD-IA family hydrolase [Roseobacter insulae]
MSADPRLVIFDVDGTLVDSQGDILAAMTCAFEAVDLPAPERGAILGIVGLSLDVAMARLAPDADHARMVEAYKDAYITLRARTGAARSSPLYPGALETLSRLNAQPDVLLGVATGKSKRGLDKLVEAHALEGLFVTRQVADFHPSKPHPSMILQAMADAGVAPVNTVMIGDTSFDMEMANAAGVHGLGVSWGYHPVTALSAAQRIVASFDALEAALADYWRASR